jgi:hypothetical protein
MACRPQKDLDRCGYRSCQVFERPDMAGLVSHAMQPWDMQVVTAYNLHKRLLHLLLHMSLIQFAGASTGPQDLAAGMPSCRTRLCCYNGRLPRPRLGLWPEPVLGEALGGFELGPKLFRAVKHLRTHRGRQTGDTSDQRQQRRTTEQDRPPESIRPFVSACVALATLSESLHHCNTVPSTATTWLCRPTEEYQLLPVWNPVNPGLLDPWFYCKGHH